MKPAKGTPSHISEPRRSEKELWNAKYAAASHTSMRPDPFLLQADKEYVRPLLSQPGEVLDVAGGVGRHALFYAKQGWKATLIDVSENGIALAEKNALLRKLPIKTVAADLNNFDTRQLRGRFDLLLVFFYLQRKLFPALVDMLKPGGLLIYKTYLRGTLKGPTHPLHLLEANELLRAFATLRVLHYRETVGESRVAEFVGRRE